MRVTLATAERHLFDLCVDVLVECYPQSYELSLVYPDSPLPQADVYIWDYDDGLDIENRLDSSRPPYHIVVLDAQYLGKFKAAIQSGTMVVLKPATKGALSAWLGQAIRDFDSADCSDARENYVRMLTEANIRLQQSEHERIRFLASALHDFRIPLTTNRGYCGILLDEIPGPLNEAQHEALRCMQNSLLRMTAISSATFDAAIGKPRNQRLLNGFAAGDIRECVKQALNEVRLFADEKRIQLEAELEPPQETLHFDRTGIERVLVNVLHNAYKFAPKQGHILVKGYSYFWERRSSRIQNLWIREDNRVVNSSRLNCYRIDIHNTGPKIAAGVLQSGRLQGDPTVPLEHGLGLAICKVIIEQHSGKIWAENDADGPIVSCLLPFRSNVTSVLSKKSDLKTGGELYSL
jgi:signal transduction histidine kinase